MRKTKPELWNTFLCNRLSSLDANIRAARTVRLAVITVTIALVGIGSYIFNELFAISFHISYVILLALAVSLCWYFIFSYAFFLCDILIEKYEQLISKNIMSNLNNKQIYDEYLKIKKIEKTLRITIIRGRFWRGTLDKLPKSGFWKWVLKKLENNPF